MTTANKITLTRIAMIPFYIFFALQTGYVNQIIALVLFCAASLTDFLDGYIARKYNQVTDFGKFVDPLADKLMVTAALLVFLERGMLASWIVFIILARELIITSLRVVAANKGRVMAATWTGKVKTCVQIAVIVVLQLLLIDAGGLPFLGLVPMADNIVLACGWVITLVTLYSGFDYMMKNWDIVAQGATKAK